MQVYLMSTEKRMVLTKLEANLIERGIRFLEFYLLILQQAILTLIQQINKTFLKCFSNRNKLVQFKFNGFCAILTFPV